MTKDELLTELSELSRYFDSRVLVYRIVVDAQGHELETIYRGSFIAATISIEEKKQ